MDSEHTCGTAAAPHGTGTAPDLTGIRLAHRAMLADIDRLAGLLAAVAAAGRPVPAGRAAAIAGYVHRYHAAARGHHRGEDRILWPVVLDAVPDAADTVAGLVRFADDHAALDSLQAACDTAADGFAADPERHARELARLLARQRDLLARHVAAAEEHLFPLITGRVPGAAYAAAVRPLLRAYADGAEAVFAG
ncbi:hemerythrin domain-containing protein [Streptomyces sp. HUAS TT3]|uniref:hemerythrin domain-containing protein n=1 Tax=Streptomyces sp. HUAS TT3 TaxID=3447510 RepID=UPI003F65F1A8